MDFDLSQTLRPANPDRFPRIDTRASTQSSYESSIAAQSTFPAHLDWSPFTESMIPANASISAPGSTYFSSVFPSTFPCPLPTQLETHELAPNKQSPTTRSNYVCTESSQDLTTQRSVYCSPQIKRARGAQLARPTSPQLPSYVARPMTNFHSGSSAPQVPTCPARSHPPNRIDSTSRQQRSHATHRNDSLFQQRGMYDTLGGNKLQREQSFFNDAQGLIPTPQLDVQEDPAAWSSLPIKTETHDYGDEKPLPGFRLQTEHMKRRQGYYSTEFDQG